MMEASFEVLAAPLSAAPLLDRLPKYMHRFCDCSLRSADGEAFQGHRLILSLVSEPLGTMVNGNFSEGLSSEVVSDFSSDALRAFLEFLYCGSTKVSKSVVPDLLRLAHQWEADRLYIALLDVIPKWLDPELCSCLLADCDALLEHDLESTLQRYGLKHFTACMQTEKYGTWPLHRLNSLLQSDDLVVENEEQLLSGIAIWHRSAPGRDDPTAALLGMVRFPLLSLASLRALQSSTVFIGAPAIVLSRRSKDALRCHGSAVAPAGFLPPSASVAGAADTPAIVRRSAFPHWWADFGCSIKSGSVVAGFTGPGATRELDPNAICIHNDILYIADGQDNRVWRWVPGATNGHLLAGPDSALNGVNKFGYIVDLAIDMHGNLFILDQREERIIQVRNGAGEVVGGDSLVLSVPNGLSIGVDGTIYIMESNTAGSRVQKYLNGVVSIVANGSANSNFQGIFVTAGGDVYVSDQGESCIYCWSPGSSQGRVVAGGHGAGPAANQLDWPCGIFVADDGAVYIADCKNNRIVKWCEGCSHGFVVAGGVGNGDGLHELDRPQELTMDKNGALYVADRGNSRVVLWQGPRYIDLVDQRSQGRRPRSSSGLRRSRSRSRRM